MGFLNILKTFAVLKREQWMDPDALEAMQKTKLEKILSHARNTEYYRDLLNGSEEEFSDLPLTRKEDIQKQPERFTANKGDIVTSVKTSGSTGQPLEVFVDQDTLDYRSALKFLRETEIGFSPPDRYAFFSFREFRSNPIIDSLGLYKRFYFSIFDEDKKIYENLRRCRANFIGGYPSVITVLAKQNLADPIKLKAAACGGEPLTEKARKFVEDSFSCELFNRYGLQEFSNIAWECPEEHNLHVNTNHLLVEIVDQEGRPKESGTGEIAITSLGNRVMPILRYATCDMGSWGKECSCGRGLRVLESLKGRKDDLIVLPSGKVRSSLTMNLMDDLTYLSIYQIIQEREDLFVFRYVPHGDDITESQRNEILEIMKRACLGEEVQIEFEKVDQIKRTKGGKVSIVISKVARRGNTEYDIWNSE